MDFSRPISCAIKLVSKSKRGSDTSIQDGKINISMQVLCLCLVSYHLLSKPFKGNSLYFKVFTFLCIKANKMFKCFDRFCWPQSSKDMPVMASFFSNSVDAEMELKLFHYQSKPSLGGNSTHE